MRFLRNPWVTGVLAVVAVVVVCYQFMPRGGVHLNWFRSKQAPAPNTTPAAPQPKTSAVARAGGVSVASNTSAEAQVLPEKGIDRQYAASHFTNWVNSPLRDPFLFLNNAKFQEPRADTNSPVAGWKLNGIWHQTGSQLIIINNRVYAPGDEVVKGYTIEKIEGDEVWVQGPNRKERLGFRELGRFDEMTSTNQPTPLSQPSDSKPRP